MATEASDGRDQRLNDMIRIRRKLQEEIEENLGLAIQTLRVPCPTTRLLNTSPSRLHDEINVITVKAPPQWQTRNCRARTLATRRGTLKALVAHVSLPLLCAALLLKVLGLEFASFPTVTSCLDGPDDASPLQSLALAFGKQVRCCKDVWEAAPTSAIEVWCNGTYSHLLR